RAKVVGEFVELGARSRPLTLHRAEVPAAAVEPTDNRARLAGDVIDLGAGSRGRTAQRAQVSCVYDEDFAGRDHAQNIYRPTPPNPLPLSQGEGEFLFVGASPPSPIPLAEGGGVYSPERNSPSLSSTREGGGWGWVSRPCVSRRICQQPAGRRRGGPAGT